MLAVRYKVEQEADRRYAERASGTDIWRRCVRKKNNDYAMWLKVCKKADCYLLPEVLARYRRGRSGSVSSHGIMTMIGWHYKLWHEAEKRSAVASLWLTGVNLVCGFYKKLKYVKKVKSK